MAKKYRRKTAARAKPKKRRSPVKRKAHKKKVSGSVRKKPAKRRKRSSGRKVVKQVERRSVERVMTGKNHKPRKRRSRARRVIMAGSRPRHRSVGGSGMGNKMLIGLGLGALAVYLLTKKTTQTTTTTQYPTAYNTPQIIQTSNYTRDTQSQDIVNYAIAAGLAADAVSKIIDRLNSSSDSEVQNVYDYVNTTGNIEYYA